jgi:hypothetical protein
MQKRRQRLELAHERARSHPHALHAPRGYSIAEEKGGRMRRPTAIMRSNVEVARLMAVPGSKQRQLSHDEYGYGEEAPQHLSTTRHKRAEAADEAHGGGGAAAHGTNGQTTQAPSGEPPLSAKRDRSGGARSGGGRPSGGARHGGSNVHGRAVPLPIVQAVPSVLTEPVLVITNATIQAILPAGVHEELPGVQRRVVSGVIVRSGASGAGGSGSGAGSGAGAGAGAAGSTAGGAAVGGAAVGGAVGTAAAAGSSADASALKRKRRPPGWLAGHENGDEGGGDDEAADASAAASGASPTTPFAAGGGGGGGHDRPRPPKKRPIISVYATLINAQRDAPPPAHLVVTPCAVAVLGVLPPPSSRSRGPMPPPLAASASSGSHLSERSPGGRHNKDSGDKGHGSADARSLEKRRLHKESSRESSKEAVGEDAFQIELASPRIIEVVRAKEIHLPQWRVLPPHLIPEPLGEAWAPRHRATLKEGRTGKAPGRSGSTSSIGSAGGDAGGAAASSGSGTHAAAAAAAALAGDAGDADEDEEDGIDDDVYERRHARTLERAIAAARSVALALFQKERQKQQSHHSSGGADGKAGEGAPVRTMTEEDEWRFRPSELAALCAAQRMGLDGDAPAADGDAGGGAGGAAAGFFGRMGGNSGGRDKKDEDAEGDAKGAAGAAVEPISQNPSDVDLLRMSMDSVDAEASTAADAADAVDAADAEDEVDEHLPTSAAAEGDDADAEAVDLEDEDEDNANIALVNVGDVEDADVAGDDMHGANGVNIHGANGVDATTGEESDVVRDDDGDGEAAEDQGAEALHGSKRALMEVDDPSHQAAA